MAPFFMPGKEAPPPMADDVGKLAAKIGLDATEFKAGITTIGREIRCRGLLITIC